MVIAMREAMGEVIGCFAMFGVCGLVAAVWSLWDKRGRR